MIEISGLPMIKIDTVMNHDHQYIGVVFFDNSDQDALIMTELHPTRKRAKREAISQFKKALFECSHQWKDEGEYSEDNAWGGIDYVHTSTCKNCGLHNTTRSDRSIYEEREG
jgi:hypothetical protein